MSNRIKFAAVSLLALSLTFPARAQISSTTLIGGTTPVSGVCTNGQVLFNNAGVLGCQSGGGGGSGTVTSVGETFTGGLISVAGSPITTAGTFALTVAGTSGGIPYFSGATTWASSAALAANALVIGGGAGAAPATTTTGSGVLTALGLTVNGSGALVATTSPALVTPALGVATATTLAIGGATLGGNALAVTGPIQGVGLISTSNINFSGILIWNSSTRVEAPANGELAISTASYSGSIILTAKGVGSLQFGQHDAAAPVAQTLGVQSVVAGTSNTAGANRTETGSQGTGTGVGGDIIWQVAKAGTTGTAQNALTEAFRLDASTALPKWPSSSTGAGAQTFTNSPCSGLTTERWISITITGQTGTWFVPACQ